MDRIFAKAEIGEAIVMEIKEKPVLVSTSFILTPIPCCSMLTRFRTSEFEFRSRFCDIATYDNRSVSLECTIKYSIQEKEILKAYKFVKKTFLNRTTTDTPQTSATSCSSINSALSVTGVIGDCLVAQAVKMTFKEMMENKNWTMQIIFNTSKEILLRHGIMLCSFVLNGVSLVVD